MATIYKVKIVSHWINYPKEELQMVLEDALKETERQTGTVITISVIENN